MSQLRIGCSGNRTNGETPEGPDDRTEKEEPAVTTSSLHQHTAELRTSCSQVGLTGSLELLEVAELVSLAAGGHSDALSELYRRYSGLLLRVAFHMLGNRQDAEEVLQEAFLYAWRKAKDYNPSLSSVSTWLVLITRSRSLDRLRARQVSRRRQSEFQREAKTTRHLLPESFAHVLGSERADRLRKAMDRLPTPQRQVLELCFYSGLTQSEAATQSGLPLGTVKTRTYLAMKKLRLELAGEFRNLMS